MFQISSHVDEVGDVVSYVNISRLLLTDGGIYTCLASNSVGSQNQTLMLNVYGTSMSIHPPREEGEGCGQRVWGQKDVKRDML